MTLEDELRKRNIEYEEMEQEVARARNREEGMLRAIGSTLKDTFQRHLGMQLKRTGSGKQLIIKSPRSASIGK